MLEAFLTVGQTVFRELSKEEASILRCDMLRVSKRVVTMAGRANQVDQMAAITRAIEVAPHAVALRAHIRNIVESPAFKGSRRSQEFLQFVVERALGRHFEDLKERTLGVELFGRDP